jgi:hypothetical protein
VACQGQCPGPPQFFPFAGPAALLELRQKLARLDAKGVRKFPDRVECYRAPPFDSLVVTQAEAPVHHVLLGETRADAKLTNALSESSTVAIERRLHPGGDARALRLFSPRPKMS